MTRVIYCAVVLVLASLMVTSTQSQTQVQTQRPRVRATRRSAPPAEMQFQSGMMDPNVDPMQRQVQWQQDFQQRMAQMQQQMAETQRLAQESRDNAIRQTLNATDEQWQRLKPRLDQIDKLKAEATVSAGPGSSGGSGGGVGFQSGNTSGNGFVGGWMGGGGMMSSSSGQPQTWSQSGNWGSPPMGGNSAEKTDGQVLCDQLLRDLQTPGAAPADITQRIAALRRIRTQAQANLARARQDLRALIAPAQEPALILMGYLD